MSLKLAYAAPIWTLYTLKHRVSKLTKLREFTGSVVGSPIVSTTAINGGTQVVSATCFMISSGHLLSPVSIGPVVFYCT